MSSLEWLGISRIRPVRMRVEPTNGTCDWITKTDAYVNWTREIPSGGHDANMTSLWIRGPVGCGKTHFAKHMWVNRDLEMDLRHSPQDTTAHCSVDDIVPGRRTSESLLLCLIFDILMAQPWLIRECLVPRYDSARAAKSSFACDQGMTFIRNLWKDVIATVAREASCLVLIADGIDKCEHPAQALRNLLDSVSEVAQLAADQGYSAQFQVLILSNRSEELDALANHDPDLEVHNMPAESIAADMRLVLTADVDTILSEHGESEDSPLGRRLWDTCLGGKEQSHGWAAIFLSELKTFKRTREDLDNLLGVLAPGDFTTLYDEIVGRRILGTTANNSSVDISMATATTPTVAQNLLFWITHQLGAMNKEELRIACSLSTEIGYPDGFPRDRSTGELTIRHLESEPQPPTINEETFDEALRICAPLLRTVSTSGEQRFTVAHDSLRGYLATIPPGTSHEIVATVCMNYLLLLPHSCPTDAGHHTGSLVGWEAEARDLIASYKFASYAATRWVDHFTLASSSPPSPRRRRNLGLLLNSGSQFMKPWTKVMWYHTKGREGEPYPMVSEVSNGGFPWAAVFPQKQVEMIEAVLKLASASTPDVQGDGAVVGGGGVGRRSVVDVENGKRSGERDRKRQQWKMLPGERGGNVKNAFRGRRGRVMVLAVIIAVLVIIGAAVGGSQAGK